MIVLHNVLVKKENVILILDYFLSNVKTNELSITFKLKILLQNTQLLIVDKELNIENFKCFDLRNQNEINEIIEKSEIIEKILTEIYKQIKEKRKLSKIELEKIISDNYSKYI